MPDPTRQTVSASQCAGLFNLSPYVTRWMLYHHFVDGLDLDAKENERMDWGKRLERPILEAAAELLHLDVVRNERQEYERHVTLPVGCTIDANTACPTRGRGIVEAKNVDWLVWKNEWTATTAPRHIEIQLQAQLLVTGATWGCIPCLVGGNELVIYPRDVMPEIADAISTEARKLMLEIAERREPDSFGAAIELPCLSALYPEVTPAEQLDLTAEPDADDWELLLVSLDQARQQSTAVGKEVDKLKAKLLAKSKTAGIVLVPGLRCFISKTAVAGGTYTRKDSVRTNIKIVPYGTEREQPDADFGDVIAKYDALHGAK